jgi:hypothetical protein
MHGLLRNTDNPNFIFYTPTAPLARRRLWNVLFSHTSYFTGRLRVEFWFFKKIVSINFILYYIFLFFSFPYLYFSSLSFLRRP